MPEKIYIRLEPCGMKYEGDRAVAIGRMRSAAGDVEIGVVHGENGLCDMTLSSSANIRHGNIFVEVAPDRNIYGADEACVGYIPSSEPVADGARARPRLWFRDLSFCPAADVMELYSEERALKILEAEKPFAVYYWTLADELDNRGLPLDEVSLADIMEAREDLDGSLDQAIGEAAAEIVSNVINCANLNKPVTEQKQ